MPGLTPAIVAGSAVVVLALPIFLIAGWPISGWALAAVLWVAGMALGLALTKIRFGSTSALSTSGLVAFAMLFRSVAVMVVVIAVAATNRHVGLSAGIVYALAYTLELGVAVLTYFGQENP